MIGGTGIYAAEGQKLPGAFRALSYVEMSLRADAPQRFSRFVVNSACAHIESLLKRMVR